MALRPRSVQRLAAQRQPIGWLRPSIRSGQFSRTEMAQLPCLCAIGVHGVGIDGIDVDAADALGIAVFNTPEMNTRSVAEHALALMFALTKRIPAADSALRAGHFAFKYEGGLRELQDAQLGVIGFGAIGRATATLARGLGMQVQVLTRRPVADIAAMGLRQADSLSALLANSDIVSLRLPSLPETRHIIDARALAQMKSSAYLINTSRGALVDEAALADALTRGAIAGAGLDVFQQEPVLRDNPLLGLPNVVLKPHIAASTEQSMTRMANAAVDGVLRVFAGEPPASLVNPAVWPRRRQP
ncbi:Glycerate dehydrogenase [Sodalis praecaptivus]|nr:Glycerate dehydrogenase [Sodalis praecaptivus]